MPESRSGADVAGCGYLGGKMLDPIRHAKNLVNQDGCWPNGRTIDTNLWPNRILGDHSQV